MTDQSSSDDDDAALSFLLRVQEDPEDDALRDELQQWRKGSPAHERAWQKILRVRMVGRLALQASAQEGASRSPLPFRARGGIVSRLRQLRWRRMAVAAAACLAVVSSVPQIRLWFQADYSTNTGETQHITLADGSEAVLGASSALDVRMDRTSRRITLLRGEALFRVKHDLSRTFVVQAGSVTSRDIGTVFDVRKGNGHVVLAVADGVIGVTPPHSVGSKTETTELRLAAGDQIDITEDNGQIRRSTIPSDSVGSWNSGIYGTNTASVNDMLSMLERYYPGYVFVHGQIPAEKLVGGVYDLRHPAESIRMLATSTGGSVSEFAGHIILVRFPS